MSRPCGEALMPQLLQHDMYCENFEIEALAKLLEIASASGRQYGSVEVLTEQSRVLEKRYKDTEATDLMTTTNLVNRF